MYTEDQDEEVEEEEEFHEVEEEKHKSSQESVGSCANERLTASQRTDTSNKSQEPQAEEHQRDQQPDTVVCINPCVVLRNEVSLHDETTKSPIQSDQTSEYKKADSSQDTSEPAPQQVEVAETGECSSDEVKIEYNQSVLKSPDDQVDEKVAGEATPHAIEEAKQVPATDWANIMLNSESKSPEANEIKDSDSRIVDSVGKIDDIIKQTEELNLHDDDDSPKEEMSQKQVDEHADQHKVAGLCFDSRDCATEKTEDQDDGDAQKIDEVEKKQLDLDEDEENPQYIPKKGDFYEHDDRSHNVNEDESAKKEGDENETKDPNINKKSSSQEKQSDHRRSNRRQRIDADRWNHDLFRDEKPKPKNDNSHGFDGRHHDRNARNQRDGRATRTTGAADRSQGSQDSRSRQSRDGRMQRQNQIGNRSRERKPRRQNVRNGRNESAQPNNRLRDSNNKDIRSKPETKDSKEVGDEKQAAQQTSQTSSFSALKKDSGNRESRDSKSTRNDSRGRRRTSRDRPNNSVEDKLPPPNTVMPPITTWSNEDMVKAEAFSKDTPSRQQSNQPVSTNNYSRNRPNELWSQGQPSKNAYQDRSLRNYEDNRHMNYNRGRYQDRGDDLHRSNQNSAGSQYNDKSHQNNVDWHRGNNFNSYGKPNDYIVKTQTFENSRLAQANRSNNRDLRDVLNERRAQGQLHFQPKPNQAVDSPQAQPVSPIKNSQYHQYAQQHMHQSHVMPHHQAPQHMLQQQQLHHQQPSSQLQPQQTTSAPPPQQQLRTHQQQNKQAGVQLHRQSPSSHLQTSSPQQHIHGQRQHINSQTNQTRQNAHLNNLADNQEHTGHGAGVVSSNDPMSSRPIIKTDVYTSTPGVAPHHQSGSQPMSQHSPRNVTGPMTQQQQGSSPASSHMVPPHLSTSSVQTQYYTPSNSARNPAAAAALASAYHGYIPGGHTVMDSTARYHMTSQQMSDHGYMTSPGQATDVTTGPVLHQQGMYAESAPGSTVPSSAYMAQAGSTLSPASNIPVTGSSGPQPLPPISYLQHSQYPPSPYSNPYPQHQHNQAPPPPGQAYPPYWTYMN